MPPIQTGVDFRMKGCDAHTHIHESKEVYRFKDWFLFLSGHSVSSNRKAYNVGKAMGFPFAVGIAPQNAQRMDEESFSLALENVKELSREAHAIGEVGLDFHWAREEEGKKKQYAMFEEMVEIAERMKLPLVIHSRKATKEVVDFLKERRFKGRILLHFFSAKLKETREAVEEFDALISIPPYKSKERKNAISNFPDRLVVETDSPYVGKTPEDSWKSAEYIASILKKTKEEVMAMACKNLSSFLNLNSQDNPLL